MPTISEFRSGMAAFADSVQHDGARVVVTSHGRPVFALVCIDDLEWLQEMDDAEDTADIEAFHNADFNDTVSAEEMTAYLAEPAEPVTKVSPALSVAMAMSQIERVLLDHFRSVKSSRVGAVESLRRLGGKPMSAVVVGKNGHKFVSGLPAHLTELHARPVAHGSSADSGSADAKSHKG